MKNVKSKILIVDDDAISIMAIEGLLSTEPYELYFASNGSDGLAIAGTLRPDLILLDVMMPLMDGFEVCRRIRAMPDIAEVPILLITSLDDQSSRIVGLQAGADDFISKPYSSVELFARLQTILRLNRYRRIAEQQHEVENLNREILIAYDKTIEGWSNALDLRDQEVEGHSKRVTEIALTFACKTGVAKEKMARIRRGALLHDVGKLGIPDSILHKPDKLTDEEWRVMHMHPVYAYQWLSSIAYLLPALDIPYCHHEKWDGTGYPRGLTEIGILFSARLFAIVDVWDALCSERPYRSTISKAEALEYIRSQAGSHFDPALVKIFIDLVKNEV